MFDETLSTCPSGPNPAGCDLTTVLPEPFKFSRSLLIFSAAVFLVTIPVFFQAPLVRQAPGFSLGLTAGWLFLSLKLLNRPATWLWGDLLLGFTWSWLTGGIYWGWLRWEPYLHLPVEATLVPITIVCLRRNWGKVGNWFYLGSLFGTAITDSYFYLTGLIPHWRQLMQADATTAVPILQSALANVRTPWGISWAVILVSLLLLVGLWPWRSGQLHQWAFRGAVLGTILVDSLFFVAASVS